LPLICERINCEIFFFFSGNLWGPLLVAKDLLLNQRLKPSPYSNFYQNIYLLEHNLKVFYVETDLNQSPNKLVSDLESNIWKSLNWSQWLISDQFAKMIDSIIIYYYCFVEVWVICPTSDKRVKVEHLISKRTHKPNALRFWVRVWRLSRLCDCSSLDVDGPPSSSTDPTVVSEPRFNEEDDRGSRSVCAESSNGGTVSVRCGETRILN